MTANSEKMGTDNANKDRQAIDLLFAERCSCVVRNGDTIRIFRERGVRDLWRLLHEEPELLDGAFVADKVVGKGAPAQSRSTGQMPSPTRLMMWGTATV